MNIGILTSSRADYSIYLPLLKALKADSFFSVKIIAFGTHLSSKYGNTVSKIEEDGFEVSYKINTLTEGDSPQAISESMGITVTQFSSLWAQVKFDMVFCLGDRYEMFAACASSVPFKVTLAHIHGGEQTLGAIDDVFRHSITLMATWHFTAAEVYKQRVIELKAKDDHVYNTGALSMDNMRQLTLLSVAEFRDKFAIDLSIPSILITFHPETVSFEKNEYFIKQLLDALSRIEGYQYIFTMPNADTMGNVIRTQIHGFIGTTKKAIGVESFGTIGYLSCMKHCSFMLGNTSSGFIEAAYFPTQVINLGDRQNGRILTDNIVSCEIKSDAIVEAVRILKTSKPLNRTSVYGNGHAAENIISALKKNR